MKRLINTQLFSRPLSPFFGLAALAALALAPQPARATTYYWDVNGNSSNNGFSTVVGTWNGTNNFWNTSPSGGTGGSVIASPTSADDLIIPQATTNTGTLTVSGARTASSITFAANVGPTVTMNGGSVTIGGTGANSGIFNQSSGANTIGSTTINLAAGVSSFNFTNSGTGTLKIANVTGQAPSGTQTINIGTSTAGLITLNGTFSEGAAGKVALNFNSSGTGTTTLSGTSSYTGGTTFTAGTVIANTSGALPGFNSSGSVVFNGGTLQVKVNGSNWAAADVDTLVTNATQTSGSLAIDTTNGGLTESTTFSGAITGLTNLGLTKAGSNNLILDQANSYSGATLVSAGILQIGAGSNAGSISSSSNITMAGGSLTFNRSDSFTVGNLIAGSPSSATVTLTGGGVMTLSNNNSTYNGNLNVNNGTVVFSVWSTNSSNGPLGRSGQTNLGVAATSTGTLEYTGASDTPNAKVLLNGPGVIQIDNANTNLNLSLGGSSSQISGSGLLTTKGPGKLTLSNSHNSFSGGLTVESGTLGVPTINNASTAGYLGNNSSVTLGANGKTGTLEVNSSAGAGAESSTMQFTLANGGVGAFQIDNAAETMTLSAAVSGGGGLTKTGAGTLVLSSTNNSYGGVTTVSSGLLSVTGSLANNGSNSIFITPSTFGYPSGSPQLNRAVGNGANYAGLGSQITDDMSTKADILAGTNTGSAATVSMLWRHPQTNEISTGSPASPPLPSLTSSLISDVLNLNGMSTGGNPAQTDPFVLQMSYNPALLSGQEAADAASGALFLAWLNPTGGPGNVPLWQNATLGNVGNNASSSEQNFQGPFTSFQTANGTSLSSYVGAWGVDPSTHNVWAVLNHNSDFAGLLSPVTVPEPSTVVLLAVGGLSLVGARRLRNRSR